MNESEPALFSELQSIDKMFKHGYARAGLICREVEARSIWKERTDSETGEPCASFTAWVRTAAPYSYATVFSAIRDVEELKDIPDKELALIPAGNFHLVRQLSTAVRTDPKVLKAAQTQRAPELAAMIRTEYPSQHIEASKVLRFIMDESAAAKIEEALTVAEERGATSRTEALESIAAEALQTWVLEAEIEAMVAETP
jgi:hypothetical protein